MFLAAEMIVFRMETEVAGGAMEMRTEVEL